jgi:hypothetical protein
LKVLKYFLLTLLGTLSLGGLYIYLNRPATEEREERLKKCQELLLAAAEKKYLSMGYTVGHPKVWYDWISPEEYATYPLLRNGKHENKRSFIISTVGGCRLEEIEYSLKD